MTVFHDKIQIAQAAMARIGAATIQSWTETSPQGTIFRASWDLLKSSCLTSDYSFAHEEAQLVYMGETGAPVRHAYRIPADVLTVRNVITTNDCDVDYQLTADEVLTTLKADLVMLFVQDAPVSVWPADFIEGVVLKLAGIFVSGLRDDAVRARELDQAGEEKLVKAQIRIKNQQPAPLMRRGNRLLAAHYGFRRQKR